MTAREFCYWLQGYFELHEANGGAVALSQPAMATVRAHLDLVHKVEPEHNSAFVAWLSHYVDGEPSCAALPHETAKMRRLLAAQFRHVIDPSYEGDAGELQKVHDGPGAGAIGLSYGPGYRC